jgi:cytidine deaminase
MTMTTPTPADRLALTICSASKGRKKPPCATPCGQCRHISELYARELAAILRERHGGSSTTADWLDGIGEHPPTAETP